MPDMITVTPGAMTLAQMRIVERDGVALDLAGDWRTPVQTAAAMVARVVEEERVVYGINTGFGLLASKSISATDVRELQVRLVRSHCAGTGFLLDEETVRLVMALKLISLARGYSGVRIETIELLLAMLERGVIPAIPAKGSVGASGDLAPLAHMSAVMIGEGEAFVDGERMPAAAALAKAGLEPIELYAKEGLGLLNGTQVSTALALRGLNMAEDAFKAALMSGALSVEAMKGSDAPFDPRIQLLGGQPGQVVVAAALLETMIGSRIRESHVDCERVQDPYSLRCQPRVMGACLDQLRMAAQTLILEANGVSDNPLVFADADEVLSGGNFHAEPVAFAADQIANAIAEIGALSERRTALLVNPAMSGLPAFLTPEPGLNSGFMMAQVTAAALVSENRQRATPASVDSLPTSADQEDHVSMATYAARRLLDMAENAYGIVAVELMAATQGISFHRPLRSSLALETCMEEVLDIAPLRTDDREFSVEINGVKEGIHDGRFLDSVVSKISLSNA
ncbi:MAG: histidine ammonia-lyase [Rhodospirillales bacterium]|jgi:histidine ammonia-lyase|nr:histidine ammonia-lyase [Rhodospirillales bacterium]